MPATILRTSVAELGSLNPDKEEVSHWTLPVLPGESRTSFVTTVASHYIYDLIKEAYGAEWATTSREFYKLFRSTSSTSSPVGYVLEDQLHALIPQGIFLDQHVTVLAKIHSYKFNTTFSDSPKHHRSPTFQAEIRVLQLSGSGSIITPDPPQSPVLCTHLEVIHFDYGKVPQIPQTGKYFYVQPRSRTQATFDALIVGHPQGEKAHILVLQYSVAKEYDAKAQGLDWLEERFPDAKFDYIIITDNDTADIFLPSERERFFDNIIHVRVDETLMFEG